MVSIDIHPRVSMSTTIYRNAGHSWVTIQTGAMNITFHETRSNEGLTLQEIADRLADAAVQLSHEQQAADHDKDESNTIPMANYQSEMPF